MTGRGERLVIHFDGGCRPNPGAMELAVVLRGRTHIRTDLGEGDNDIAEWLALRQALDMAIAEQAIDVVLIGDSVAVVQQALGRWRCHAERLRVHQEAFRVAAAGIPRLHLRHVRRSKNLAGIALDHARLC